MANFPIVGSLRCSMPSGTSIFSSTSIPFEYHFTVTPSNGSSTLDTSSKAIVSIFDIMSSAKTPPDNIVRAHQCGLWFCLQSYNVTVTNGIVDRSVIVEWSKSEAVPKSSANSDEYVFVDIPPQMNAKEHARYSVPSDSLKTLRAFIDKLTLGNASQVAGVVSYDSDWVQAIEAATGDLSGWISRLALSLTNDIWLTGTVRPNGNVEYGGTAYIMAPHIEVNWFWVAYPVSLMIFAFLYLMQTVWRTAHDQVCAWKTDSLPVSDFPICLLHPCTRFRGNHFVPDAILSCLKDHPRAGPRWNGCAGGAQLSRRPHRGRADSRG